MLMIVPLLGSVFCGTSCFFPLLHEVSFQIKFKKKPNKKQNREQLSYLDIVCEL